MQLIIARECELNAWTMKSMVRTFKEMGSERDDPFGRRFHVEKRPNGKYFVIRTELDGEEVGQSWLPEVRRDSISKYFLDIATLDKKFFAVAQDAYDALAEVDHVRDYLLEMEKPPPGCADSDSDYRYGLPDYALEELDEAGKALSALYKFCSGKELTTHRMR